MPSQRTTQTKTSEHDRPSQASAAAKSSAAPAMHPMLHLQRQVGNQAVGRLIQAKLTVGEPNDVYEQEADRVATAVVSQIHAPQNVSTDRTASVQRQAIGGEEEELRRKPIIQCKSDVGGMAVSSEIESSIQQARGSGQPLSDSIRTPMEQAFGADFSGVRVHTGAESDRLNQEVQARAFTTGQDVFFRQGEYCPGSRGGQELLAHELTHVLQQGDYIDNDKEKINDEIHDFSKTENTKSNNWLLQKTRYDIQRMRIVIPCDTPKENLECHTTATYMADPNYGNFNPMEGTAKDLKPGEVLHLISHGSSDQFGKYDENMLAIYIFDTLEPNSYLKEIHLHGCESNKFAPKLQEAIKLFYPKSDVKVHGIPGYSVTTKQGLEYYNEANKKTEEAIEEIKCIERAFYIGIMYAEKGEISSGDPYLHLAQLMEETEAKKLTKDFILKVFKEGEKIGSQKSSHQDPKLKEESVKEYVHTLMTEYGFKLFEFISNQQNIHMKDDNPYMNQNNNNNLSKFSNFDDFSAELDKLIKKK